MKLPPTAAGASFLAAFIFFGGGLGGESATISTHVPILEVFAGARKICLSLSLCLV